MDLTKMGMIQLQNPSHPTGLLCKANQMRLAGTLCDVVIMVDSQEFHAHRTVLACTSKMFEILFHRNSQHYTLDFLSPKTFQQILEYAYTATLQAKAEDLDDLLYAAEILEIEYLEEQCLKILETIQASDDNDTEATMADGGAEEEEDRKARYLKNIFISKHSSEESGYASVAAQSLPGPMVDQSPSVSTSFGLSAMSPTKAAVDSLMTIGQSLLQGTLQPPAGPEEPTLAGGGRHPGVAEVKTEMMQVDEVPGQDSPGAAESTISGGMGDKMEERGKEGPGTPTRSSVITSARELHYGREESAEQLPPPAEAGQGPPGRPEHPAPSAEKHLGVYSVLPNHKADAVLSMPSSVTSGLHVQPALAVSMDFSTYGGLLPQGFIQRELFNKLGELAVGMKSESRTIGEQCSVCGVELPDNEAVEQHRKLHSGMKTYGCELCGKRFLDSLRLRMHLLAHSGQNQERTKKKLPEPFNSHNVPSEPVPKPLSVISAVPSFRRRTPWRHTGRPIPAQTWRSSVCCAGSGSRRRARSSSTWRSTQACAATSAASATAPSPATPPSNATCAHTQATTRTSVSSVAAASGMRAHSRATNVSTRARNPTSAMAVARSSASSTSWRRTIGCTQVRSPLSVSSATSAPGTTRP
ncbi:zinc finger and BTB domain-containing protein 16 isoform X4 [Equus quagga]|uniref:zinc finger and BTB domain-containing protein 16 isoform X4 n=1 Tax=Equus quagga TaxID=89248 RepID=UPI001EE25B12|nr:zinc finger and BTB domain-containing protein 16 isoform X4 [Equus quagga]